MNQFFMTWCKHKMYVYKQVTESQMVPSFCFQNIVSDFVCFATKACHMFLKWKKDQRLGPFFTPPYIRNSVYPSAR